MGFQIIGSGTISFSRTQSNSGASSKNIGIGDFVIVQSLYIVSTSGEDSAYWNNWWTIIAPGGSNEIPIVEQTNGNDFTNATSPIEYSEDGYLTMFSSMNPFMQTLMAKCNYMLFRKN